MSKKMIYTHEEIQKFKLAWEREQKGYKSSFLGTRFLKRRTIIVFISFVALLLLSSFIPESETELDFFSILFVIPFLLMVAFIDQIIFGWYLFSKTEKGKEVIK